MVSDGDGCFLRVPNPSCEGQNPSERVGSNEGLFLTLGHRFHLSSHQPTLPKRHSVVTGEMRAMSLSEHPVRVLELDFTDPFWERPSSQWNSILTTQTRPMGLP